MRAMVCVISCMSIVYIMAVDEPSAAYYFHKSRARDYSNDPHELIVQLLRFAIDCDG